ncbi:MAG: hypothetical protein DSY89_04630, partial [Deltaproteobacteria bacterium]
HLSSKRSNIIRGLNLKDISRVLEIGCGCGAITRYLGEQGLEVDAVEGAGKRAEIARLRCRDLKNVNIINANFNDLIFPEKFYDAIFIIGAIEYAGRFLTSAANDEVAVVTILQRLGKALRDDGALVVAIENRNGLKYWMGATEDHYARPYVGLTGYWGLGGVKTYDLETWKRLLQEAEYPQWRFQFPFPDYKLPQVILDEDFIDTDRFAHSLLYQIGSRDYLGPWKPGGSEYALWRAMHKDGKLKQYANSFLILAGKSRERIRKTAPLDFIYYSDGARKPEYRTITVKKPGEDKIRKKNIWPGDQKVSVKTDNQEHEFPYIQGELLSTRWLESLVNGRPEKFEICLSDYYAFICDYFRDKDGLAIIDALPANIIVDEKGNYRIFDHEWDDSEHVTIPYVLFRALLFFAQNNRDHLRTFFKNMNFGCTMDFISYGFSKLDMNLSHFIEEFIRHEEDFQFKICSQTGLSPVRELLMLPLEIDHDRTIFTTLEWKTTAGTFNPVDRQVISWDVNLSPSMLRFVIYSDECITKLRIRPIHTKGFFAIEKVDVRYHENDEVPPVEIYRIDSATQVVSEAVVNNAMLVFTNPCGVFYAKSDKAAIEFSMAGHDKKGTGRYECRIWMASPVTYECAWAEAHIGRVENRYQSRLVALERKMVEKEQFAKTVSERIRAQSRTQRRENDALIKENQTLKDELHRVNATLSNAWQILNRIGRLKFLRLLTAVLPGKYGWLKRTFTDYQPSDLPYRAIQESGLFDAEFYRRQASDLDDFDGDLLQHYLDVGAEKGLNPHRLFHTRYYYDQVPVLMAEGINPLYHFLSSGAYDDKDPCYLFSSRYYLKENTEVAASRINPLVHYVSQGAAVRSDPHPAFDTHFYLDHCPEKAEGIERTPLEAFLEDCRLSPRLSPNAIFNPDFYLSNRPDVEKNGICAFQHYMEGGYREKDSDPSPFFDTGFYYQQNPRLLEEAGNPLSHFIEAGQFAGKSPHPIFDINYYRKQTDYHPGHHRDPLSTYLTEDRLRGISPHPLFDSTYYAKQLKSIGIKTDHPLEHYILTGAEKRISPHPLFDGGYYLAQFGDSSRQAGTDLMLDYDAHGIGKADPHPLFDSRHYVSQLKAGEVDGVSPLAHYLTIGRDKGLSPHPWFDGGSYKKKWKFTGTDPIVNYIYEGSGNENWPHPEIEQLSFKPKINLLLMADGRDFTFLPGVILSVMSQLYPRWRMCVAVRNPDRSEGCLRARALIENDHRMQFLNTGNKTSFAEIANLVLKEKLSGEYALFLNQHQFLHADAILHFVKALNVNRDLTLIHSGTSKNDRAAASVRRFCPENDPMTVDFFIGPLALFRRSVIDQINGFESRHHGASDHRFLINYIRNVPPGSIMGSSRVLHHTMYQDPLKIEAVI